jgi:hypothetical protein
LNGNRGISKEQAKQLAELLRVPVNLFVQLAPRACILFAVQGCDHAYTDSVIGS